METMWQFETAKFCIVAAMVEDDAHDLSWADEETLADIESGKAIVFGTVVRVYCDGHKVGEDSLWGSVYSDPREFFEAHRGPDPMDRNCSLMRAARGDISICHYFPDMVREAVRDARATMAKLGTINLRK